MKSYKGYNQDTIKLFRSMGLDDTQIDFLIKKDKEMNDSDREFMETHHFDHKLKKYVKDK